MTEDARLALARELFGNADPAEPAVQAALGLLAYAEERLRVNVGLLAENAQLRRRLA